MKISLKKECLQKQSMSSGIHTASATVTSRIVSCSFPTPCPIPTERASPSAVGAGGGFGVDPRVFPLDCPRSSARFSDLHRLFACPRPGQAHAVHLLASVVRCRGSFPTLKPVFIHKNLPRFVFFLNISNKTPINKHEITLPRTFTGAGINQSVIHLKPNS